MATHSSVLAWRIPGMARPGGLPFMGSHRAGHDWSNLASAAGLDSTGYPHPQRRSAPHGVLHWVLAQHTTPTFTRRPLHVAHRQQWGMGSPTIMKSCPAGWKPAFLFMPLLGLWASLLALGEVVWYRKRRAWLASISWESHTLSLTCAIGQPLSFSPCLPPNPHQKPSLPLSGLRYEELSSMLVVVTSSHHHGPISAVTRRCPQENHRFWATHDPPYAHSQQPWTWAQHGWPILHTFQKTEIWN